MARKLLINGKIYEATGSRKVVLNGAIFEEAVASAPVASTATPIVLPKEFTAGYSTNKKPTVPVEIDWNQSLSKDIVVCYILGDSPHNLGNEQEAGSITISEFGVASGGTGQRTYDTDSAAKIITDNPDGNIWDEANTNHTIGFVGTILTDDNGAQGLWSIGGTGHGIGVGYKIVPHTLQLEYDFSVLELATQTVFPGDTIAPVVTSDTVGQTLHLKGDSVSSTNVMGSHTGDPELGSSYKNNAAFGGISHLFVIWRRVLTDEEIALFQANPYQILKPSIPALYYPAIQEAVQSSVYPLELPKQFTPGFSTSKKPTVPVELDRSNALCPDEFCVFLDNSPSDLVSGGVLTSNVDIERVIVNGSEARHFDGTAQEHYTLPKPMVSHGNAGVWTLTFRARRTGLSNDGVLLGVAGTSTDYIWLKAGNFTVNATGIQVNIFMPAYDSADMHTYTVFFDGTGYYHLSIDGEYYATSAYSESISSLEISHIGACYTSAAYAYNGDFEYTHAHSRKLSASEIKSLHENPYQILKPSIPAVYFPSEEVAGGGDGDDLLANDVESASEVTSPSLTQIHTLLGGDIESSSEITSPAIAQVHKLFANDVESASEVTTPALTESHVLLADNIESNSEVSAPGIGQEHNLLTDSVESTSEISSPALIQEHSLSADNVESSSELSAPTLSSSSTVDNLFSEDLESTSILSTPALGQEHILASTNVDSASELSTPNLTSSANTDNLSAEDLESASVVSVPDLGQVHNLLASGVESQSEINTVAITQEHSLFAEDISSNPELSTPTLAEAVGQDNLSAENITSTSEVSVVAIEQIHVIPVSSIEALSNLTTPAIGQIHSLLANSIESLSEVSTVNLNGPISFKDTASFTVALNRQMGQSTVINTSINFGVEL